jgi:hypothetical protein
MRFLLRFKRFFLSCLRRGFGRQANFKKERGKGDFRYFAVSPESDHHAFSQFPDSGGGGLDSG